jgi:hypothetical protein
MVARQAKGKPTLNKTLEDETAAAPGEDVPSPQGSGNSSPGGGVEADGEHDDRNGKASKGGQSENECDSDKGLADAVVYLEEEEEDGDEDEDEDEDEDDDRRATKADRRTSSPYKAADLKRSSSVFRNSSNSDSEDEDVAPHRKLASVSSFIQSPSTSR